MPDELDYKTAYEVLAKAVDEAEAILFRASLLASARLRVQGNMSDEEIFEEFRKLNSQS